MARRLMQQLGLAALMMVAFFPVVVLFKQHLVFAGQNAGWPLLAGEIVAIFAAAYAIDVSKKGNRRGGTALIWLGASALFGGIAFVQTPNVRQRVASENLAKLETAGLRQIQECGSILPPLQARIDAAKLSQQAVSRELSNAENTFSALFDSRVFLVGSLACALLAAFHALLAWRGAA